MHLNLKILFTFSLLWLLNGAFSNNLNYKILDGEWEVVFDTPNKSGSHNIEDIKQIFDSIEPVKINVPSCLETYRKDYEGVAIYRKSFFVQEDWRSTNIEIQFEAVNYIAEVWLNNEVVGTHKGGYSPFSFRINETIEIGDTNTLFVRVVTPIILTNQRIDGLGRYEVPSWRGAINGGIWQSVALKSFGKIKIQDVFIKPNYKDHSVVMELEMENTTESKKTVNTVIHFRDSDNHLLKEFDFEITLAPGRNYFSKNTILQNVKNWEPSSPSLYSINISAYQNENLNDQWRHRFGFREFTMENGRFHLNGKEFFLKGTFFEGVYPIQLSWPNDIKIARKEIQLAIDAGFNMIRPWRKPPPKMWLDLCDEMGVLTVGSIAVECMHRPIATPSLPEMVEIEVRESIMRDRNRTCIIQWELFNELWQPALKQMMRPMALLARTIDPTRIILDESGGFADGANFYLPYENSPTKFNDIHNYPGWKVFENWISAFLGVGLEDSVKKARGLPSKGPGDNVVPGLPIFLSEIGYGSIPNFENTNKKFKQRGNPLTAIYRDHFELQEGYDMALKETGFNIQHPDISAFSKLQHEFHGRLNRRMIEGARINPMLTGYCVHALCAGDWILGAGIIDIWRDPKGAVFTETAKANEDRILVMRAQPRNVYVGSEINLQSIFVNELNQFKGSLTIELEDIKSNKIWFENFNVDFKSGINKLNELKIKTVNLNGKYYLVGKIFDQTEKLVYKRKIPINVYVKSSIKTKRNIYVLESDKRLRNYLLSQGVLVKDYTSQLDKKGLLLVGKLGDLSDDFKLKLDNAKKFATNGGNVIYLDYRGKLINDWKPRKLPEKQIASQFPYNMAIINTNGLWQSSMHLLKDHPIFEGITENDHMDEVFENIGPTKSFFKPEGKIISGVISTDRFPDQDKMKRHVIGVGDVWYASDLSEIKYGKGLLIPTTMKILNFLNKDPVADKMLHNMLNYYAN